MTLPNFLGIGAMRSGTSWLHVQLRGHKQVYMSEQKELHFFNDFYDQGIGWYSKHFPSETEAAKYRAIGEITPTYMADPEVPVRIHRHIPHVRLIVMLRNPVDRAYSEYTKALRDSSFSGTFEAFAAQRERALVRGYYTEQLERCFRLFSREQFLVLVFEDAVSDHHATARSLGTFLDIDPDGFDLERMKQAVNPSYLPRFPRLYASAIRLRRFLVGRDLGWAPVIAGRIGLIQAARRVFRFRGPRSELPEIEEATRRRLTSLYSGEIRDLEALLGRDLSVWRSR